MPSVIGVRTPNKNKPGPILNWNRAMTFLSHKLNIPDIIAKIKTWSNMTKTISINNNLVKQIQNITFIHKI